MYVFLCVSSITRYSYSATEAVAVLGKNIWGAWPLTIWEATAAKQNYYRTN